MAQALQGQSKLHEAELLHREAVAGYRRRRGDSHPDTVCAIANFAALLQRRGKLAEAVPLLREALGQFRRNVGDTHNSTLLTAYNLAGLLQACGPGRYEEAEVLLRKTLDAWRATDDSHPNTLTCIRSLGILLIARGKHAEGKRLLREANEGQSRVFATPTPAP